LTEHHFFADPANISGGRVVLTGDEAHHAAKVLRVAMGERITVADGCGRVVEAVVAHVGTDVEADVCGERAIEARRPEIWLYQALAKGDKLDDVIEKAGEIGVGRVIPFEASRSIVRWDERKKVRAVDRWRAIARAAAKQSRSPWITAIEDIAPDAAGIEPGTFVLHEGASTRLRDVLPDQAPDRIGVAVGPEGGFADDEVTDLEGRGGHVVSLGPRILRTETAGLVAATVIAYRYGSVG
jgi:16S rRNA (uracil1498-N3)-methyltransferase